MTDSQPTSQPDQSVDYAVNVPRQLADLTLGQLIGHLLIHPLRTLTSLSKLKRDQPDWLAVEARAATPAVSSELAVDEAIKSKAASPVNWALVAAVIALWGVGLVGQMTLFGTRAQPIDKGFPILGLLLIVANVLFAVLAALYTTNDRLSPLKIRVNVDRVMGYGLSEWIASNVLRLLCAALAIVGAYGAWQFNISGQFSAPGVFCWLLSIGAVFAALYQQPSDFQDWLTAPFRWLNRLFDTPVRLRPNWTFVTLVVILLIGGWLRFNNVSAYPPDMTSDHVEKVRDAFLIDTGYRPIFLANNGGRETAYFYFLVLLHRMTGIPYTFELIKIGSGIWGMMMIFVAWWMGRAIIGEENRRLGNLVGLLMAALIATSYWHIMLSRLGLRIVLTPVVTGILLIFLVRGFRYNRRVDFLWAGVTLGIGLYCYQAVRMLPLVIVIGWVLAVLLRARSWASLLAYIKNGCALVLIALVIFIPLGRYAYDAPTVFWNRSIGRLFGEETVEVRDPKTNELIEVRAVPWSQRLETFRTKSLPILGDNFVKSFWMFNWQGDRAWITGSASAEPELDNVAGVFFFLGLGILAVRLIRRRDPADPLMLVGLLVMLLPTALSIAFVVEVPSATRASGTLPMVYFIAALGAATVVQLTIEQTKATMWRRLLWAGLVLLLIMGATQNWNTYFAVAMPSYRESTYPYRQVGEILRGFSESGTGSSGNAFMVNYPHWLDDRAIGIEAGDPMWRNGVLEDNLEQRLLDIIRAHIGTPYEFRPDREVLFFLNKAAADSLATVRQLFPGGTVTPVQTFTPERDFLLYKAPAVGCDWIMQYIGITSLCTPDSSSPANTVPSERAPAG